jgi:hypothetical protein
MKYFLPILLLAGCSPAGRQAQFKVADSISQAANATVPSITAQYKQDLRECLVPAETKLQYEVCASKVEERWSRLRLAWSHLRRVQDEYASALEKHEPILADYAQWLQTAYCHLKEVAPPSLKLPSVPGLKCDE